MAQPLVEKRLAAGYRKGRIDTYSYGEASYAKRLQELWLPAG
ncbi:MAG: hypothetical protein V7K40_05690 [Nostoc sp.]